MKQKCKETKVFALILENNVYIGRTAAKKVSAVCYSHYRGRQEETADCFGVSIRKPTLYLLRRITAHPAVIDHYVAAWIHVFAQAGYPILNQGDVVAHAADLRPETAVIVDEILLTPLEAHLDKCRCARYADADNLPAPPVPPVHNEPATVKPTRAEQRITELEESLSTERKKLAQQDEAHRKDIAMIRKGLAGFLQYFDSASPIPLTIAVDWYEDYMRTCRTDFSYPEQEGFALIRPVAVLRRHGTDPALFVLGVTAGGTNIQLRYDPRQNCLGLFITHPHFGFRGSTWLVGWQRAEDNVMQLRFSLPLQIKPTFQNPMDPKEWK